MMYSPSDQEVAVELARLERRTEEDDAHYREEARKQREKLRKVPVHVTGKQLLTVFWFFLALTLLSGYALWRVVTK
jgi:hypothetical protein